MVCSSAPQPILSALRGDGDNVTRGYRRQNILSSVHFLGIFQNFPHVFHTHDFTSESMTSYIIRAIGKPQTDWQRDAIELYRERLSSLARVSLITLEEGHQGSAKPDEVRVRSHEAERLVQSIPTPSSIIALDQHGKSHDTESLAVRITEWTDGGKPIVFLLGGSWGLDPSIHERANATISLGHHTMPHILARIVLLEQLYRVEMIRHGKTYHK